MRVPPQLATKPKGRRYLVVVVRDTGAAWQGVLRKQSQVLTGVRGGTAGSRLRSRVPPSIMLVCCLCAFAAFAFAMFAFATFVIVGRWGASGGTATAEWAGDRGVGTVGTSL